MNSKRLSSILAAVLVVTAIPAAVTADTVSNVLDAGDRLPDGFESIDAVEQPDTKWRRIEARYRSPKDGSTIRFTTMRGSKEMGQPGRPPIDVCVRDGASGELLLDPQIYGATPMIEGCGRDVRAPATATQRYPQILEALDALAGVRFKPEYRAEFIALVNQTTRAIPAGQDQTELGGGLIIHKKGPALPAPGATPPAPTPSGGTGAAAAEPAKPAE